VEPKKPTKSEEKKKKMSRSISVNSPGNPWNQSWRRKGRLRWEGFAEKEGLSMEKKTEGVIDTRSYKVAHYKIRPRK